VTAETTIRACCVRLLTAAAIALALAACSGPGPGGSAAGSRSLSASSTPSRQSFTSARHGYRVEVPRTWQVAEYEGMWTSLDQFDPGTEIPGEDVLSPSDISSFLVVNSMAIPKAMRADEWLEAFDALVASGLDPDCPGRTKRTVLAGERATIVEQSCEGSTIVGRSTTHGGRGYYFTVRFPEEDATARATFDGILASIRFTDPP
jgi:hypothetical protein